MSYSIDIRQGWYQSKEDKVAKNSNLVKFENGGLIVEGLLPELEMRLGSLMEIVTEHIIQLQLPEEASEDEVSVEFHEDMTSCKTGRKFVVIIHFHELLSIPYLCLYLHHKTRGEIITYADSYLLCFPDIISLIDIREERRRPHQKLNWVKSIRNSSSWSH